MEDKNINITENQQPQTAPSETVQTPGAVLNERQLTILEQEGLPADYNALSKSQQAAIMAIEEMLCATEEKYGISLYYISYGTDSWGGTDDSLIACPVGGFQDLDAFEILRGEDGQITDNYIHVNAENLFTQYIQNHAEAQLGESTTKVYGTVLQVNSGKIPVSLEDIPQNVDGFWLVFVDGEKVTEEDFLAFAEGYAAWKQENGFTGNAQLILTREGVHIYLTQFNYMDYLTKDHYLQRYHCNG